jgi:glutaredoxin 2
MKSFFAEIETETGSYYIDQKADRAYNQFAVMHNGGAVYLDSVQACLDWIESHSDYILSTAV